ncbi:MAG: hypothetical protein M3Q19_10740 [Pseudomonadota bacterium]|nr:hypothetical protein [Pseudomonadota bacterium]
MQSALRLTDVGLNDSLALLASIRTCHERLAAEIDNMESLTQEAKLDTFRLSSLRWRLSQASLARRTLSSRLCDQVRPFLAATDLANIKQLQEADRALARESANHVGRWSAGSIEERWADYCEASREVRRKMAIHLELEQKLLFPILARLARHQR